MGKITDVLTLCRKCLQGYFFICLYDMLFTDEDFREKSHLPIGGYYYDGEGFICESLDMKTTMKMIDLIAALQKIIAVMQMISVMGIAEVAATMMMNTHYVI